MSSAPRYPKAPITEALIEIRVQQSPGTTVDDLLRCHAGEEKTYPQKRNLKLGTGLIEWGEQLSTSTSTRDLGFLFVSGDQRQVWQVRLDGFSVSRLAPYEGWEPFRDEARRLWGLYRKALKPVRIERIAVRYINRIDIPGRRVELKDYLRTSPETADGLPPFGGFFMQLQIPFEDIRAFLLLNETLVQPPREGILSVALDIDLFRTDDLPQQEQDIWQLIETLRRRKNEIFEACITDRARELFH